MRQMGARRDAIPNAAGGEGGHGAATPGWGDSHVTQIAESTCGRNSLSEIYLHPPNHSSLCAHRVDAVRPCGLSNLTRACARCVRGFSLPSLRPNTLSVQIITASRAQHPFACLVWLNRTEFLICQAWTRIFSSISPILLKDVNEYRPGGYYPIQLGQSLRNRRYLILRKLGYKYIEAVVWLARDKT